MVMEVSPLIRKLDHLYPLSDHEKRVLGDAFVSVVQFSRAEDVIREDDCPTSCNLLHSLKMTF
jgi:hypothetical protein